VALTTATGQEHAPAITATDDSFRHGTAADPTIVLATQECYAGAHGGRVLCHDRDHAFGVDTSPLAERRGS
jgi:hypothetical protein